MYIIIIHDFYGEQTLKISLMISQLSKLLDKLDQTASTARLSIYAYLSFQSAFSFTDILGIAQAFYDQWFWFPRQEQ